MDAETPTPGGSTVVTPSIVLPPELRPLSKPTTTTAAAPADAADPVDALDLSLPLSTLLRESTKIAHTQAEHSSGAIALAGGTLRVQEYVRYLALLWVVYTVLEREIERHVPAGGEGVEADVLALLWDEKSGGKGRMLRRSESLADDIEYFVSRLSEEERSTPAYSATATTTTTSTIPTPPFPIPAFLQGVWQTPPPALTQFTTHLHHISATRPALLLAHAYVRYLGDLSGGQIVRGKIRRVYALPSSTTTGPSSSTRGTRFYEFDAVAGDIPVAGEAQQVQGHGHGQESMYERKLKMGEVKDWFRRVLDSGTADGREDLKRE
ncbi:hypothetical protein QFC19_008958 [Naganishia cerealis]|uniref:Uncharacterized protein n=1 Tax=Naganishia cerealis TaxID=610337 RepID=A0ACC2UXE5_9TREE|nr:hypothetical protein QFC19_008958 [Naganishia cerealis]